MTGPFLPQPPGNGDELRRTQDSTGQPTYPAAPPETQLPGGPPAMHLNPPPPQPTAPPSNDGTDGPTPGGGQVVMVDTHELRDAAGEHERRGQDWATVAANPPNDPDELAAAWGPIAHPVTEQLRATNARRTAAATDIRRGHEDLATKLRSAAHAYDGTDQTSAAGVNSTTIGL